MGTDFMQELHDLEQKVVEAKNTLIAEGKEELQKVLTAAKTKAEELLQALEAELGE